MEGACLPVRSVQYDQDAAKNGDFSSMSVDQYLSWVRDEADELPLVGRAENVDTTSYQQTSYMPQTDTIEQCNPAFLPDEAWARDALYTFSELRRKLAALAQDEANKERAVKVPPMKHRKSWMLFCLGVVGDDREDNKCEPMELGSGGGGGGEEEVTEKQRRQQQQQEEEEKDEAGITTSGKKRKIAKGEVEENDELLQSKRLLSMRMGLDNHEDNNTTAAGADGSEALPSAAVAPKEGKGDLSSPPPPPPLSSSSASSASTLVDGEWHGATCQLPTTSLLLQFDQVLTQHLLAMHCEWLQQTLQEKKQDQEQGQPTDAMEMRGQWMYGLLARLEKPLYHEAAAAVRSVYRVCSALRAALSEQSPTFQSDLPSLNVLISITGSYFGQSETTTMIFDQNESEEEEGDDDDSEGEDET